MRRFIKKHCWLFFAWLPFAAHAAGPYGVDNGWAIDNSGNPLLTTSVATSLSQGETGWIRISMRLIPGHTNWDATMLGYYDTAVNNARNAGLQVLLLIGNEAWGGGQSAWAENNYENNHGTNGDNIYIEGFATNAAVPIVQHFHDRVKIYEIWNEPNAWTSNPSNGVYTGGSFIYQSNYGWLLARTWEAVHKTANINDVTLFFGGVFGHNIGGVTNYANAGAQYIDDTYNTGTNVNKGGSFAYIHSKYSVYPLDGVGEHVYLSQAGTVVGSTFRQYEDWVRQAYTKYEGTNTTKKTFITEFGWQTPTNGIPSQAVQDTDLVTAFSAIQATPYVQMAIWFSWEDNVAAGLYFGVLDKTGLPKQSYHDYQKYESVEGEYSDGTTNANVLNYFRSWGQAALGNPCDNSNGWWVYVAGGGYSQDFAGGSHLALSIMTSTIGTFEVNNLHGLWSYYTTNHGASNYGYPTNNEFSTGGGTRQDFSAGYLAWDTTNLVTWHPSATAPPAVPTGLTATPGNGQVALRWNSAAQAAGYNVKHSRTSGGPYTTVAGPIAATNYADTNLTNGAVYYFVVSAVNSLGESTNSAQVSALPASPPVITSQPQSTAVNQNSNCNLSVTAASAVAPSYQWQFNGTNINGATGTMFTLTNAQPSGAGSYTVIVSNYGGSTSSSNAIITVKPLLSISSNGGKLVMSWTGSFILQSATNVTGPYADVPGAANPFTNSNNALPQQFFRLRN